MRQAIIGYGLLLGAAVVMHMATAASPLVWLVFVAIVGCVMTIRAEHRARAECTRALQQALRRLSAQDESRDKDHSFTTIESLRVELDDRAQRLLQNTEALQAECHRLALILSSMTEGVIAIDLNENIRLANDASHAAMEGDVTEAVGRPLRELVRSVQIHELAAAALRQEQPPSIECELPRTNRIVTVKADLIDEKGEPTGAVLTIHDISELRRLERIRQEFVANVSHELKTPLTAIQACADTLSQGAIEDPGPAMKFLARIEEQCARLNELVNDMLALARIESGGEHLEILPIDLERLLQDLARERERIAAGQSLSMSVVLCTAPFAIRSDLTSLRTLVGNLADNAIKYTPPGGSVILELDRTDDTAIIRVRDTGIGIDRQHIKRIFQRFYRVDSARSRESGGSGLGLAIVKHLCQQLSGTIDVSSEPDVGSTFTVELPVGEPA